VYQLTRPVGGIACCCIFPIFSLNASSAPTCDSLTLLTYTFIVRPMVLCRKNRLNRFVVNSDCVKVRGEPAAEGVPAVPLKRFVEFEHVALRLVVQGSLAASDALLDCRCDYTTGEIIEVQWLAVSCLKDRQLRLRKYSRSQLMRFESLFEDPYNGNGRPAPPRFRFVLNTIPDRTVHA